MKEEDSLPYWNLYVQHLVWFLIYIGSGSVTKWCLTLGNPWTATDQTFLSRGFSRQIFWSGLPFPSLGDLPNAGIEPRSPILMVDSFFFLIYFNWRLITLQYCIGFAIHWHESATGVHVSHPEPPSHLPPHPTPLGHPSAPGPSTLYHASNLDWDLFHVW